jgi:acyl-CoA dehydrogenase
VIDFEPTDEQSLIVETLRQFAENEIRPKARECNETRKLPDEVLAHAHELGLVSGGIDAAFGGGGERSAVTGALIAEELAWGDLSIALAILSPTLLALPLQDLGSDAQKRALLPRFTADAFVPGSLALVEPRFDADPFRPTTRAQPENGDFLLSGRKCFVPWLPGGDTVLVVAASDQGPQGFLVPRDAPGLTAELEKNMGIDALPTVELALEAVRVPGDARLGDGRADLTGIVHRGRVALAAAALGVARASYETALEYAKEREAFGAPIATKQAIAFKLADMAIEIDGARLLVWEAAWTLDQGRDATRAAALAQQQASKVALEVSDGAVQILGGHGYTREYLPEMHLRNARGFVCFEALALV